MTASATEGGTSPEFLHQFIHPQWAEIRHDGAQLIIKITEAHGRERFYQIAATDSGDLAVNRPVRSETT